MFLRTLIPRAILAVALFDSSAVPAAELTKFAQAAKRRNA